MNNSRGGEGTAAANYPTSGGLMQNGGREHLTPAAEASKMLEAALQQMDGIIAGKQNLLLIFIHSVSPDTKTGLSSENGNFSPPPTTTSKTGHFGDDVQLELPDLLLQLHIAIQQHSANGNLPSPYNVDTHIRTGILDWLGVAGSATKAKMGRVSQLLKVPACRMSVLISAP